MTLKHYNKCKQNDVDQLINSNYVKNYYRNYEKLLENNNMINTSQKNLNKHNIVSLYIIQQFNVIKSKFMRISSTPSTMQYHT